MKFVSLDQILGQETRGKMGIRLFLGHMTRLEYRYGLGNIVSMLNFLVFITVFGWIRE